MAGAGYNPIPFQKKSSLFAVFPVNPCGSACLLLRQSRGPRCDVSSCYPQK